MINRLAFLKSILYTFLTLKLIIILSILEKRGEREQIRE